MYTVGLGWKCGICVTCGLWAQVLARSSPTDKFTLVSLLRKQGEVVAVTGDGKHLTRHCVPRYTYSCLPGNNNRATVAPLVTVYIGGPGC